jgi:hypothetical protein
MAISSVILGCGTFGGIGGARDLIGRGLDGTAAADTMDEAVRLGILLWDTAADMRSANAAFNALESPGYIDLLSARQPVIGAANDRCAQRCSR